MTELRGLQKPAPVMAAVFTLVMMASIGLPGLNGFVSEFLVLSGTFLTHRWWAVVATSASSSPPSICSGPTSRSSTASPTGETPRPGTSLAERLVIAPLIILIVVLGVYPKPVLDRITPSVNRLMAQVETATDTPTRPTCPPAAVASAAGQPASRRRRPPPGAHE